MRRSSRIQTKQQENATDPKTERTPKPKPPRAARLPVRNMKVLSPKRNSNQKAARLSKVDPRKFAKNDAKAQNRSNLRGKTTQSTAASSSGNAKSNKRIQVNNDADVIIKQDKSTQEATPASTATSGKPAKNELSVPLLVHEDSDDSILSDVANSLKIDRTIKNLSPRKFFHNKDPKTTRSGKNFSPYDFASYSALFGSICAKQNKTKNGAGVSEGNKENLQPANKRNRRKRARRERKERSEMTKRPKKQSSKSRKMVMAAPEEWEELEEADSGAMRNEVFVRAEKHQLSDFVRELGDDLFSENVPVSFWFDFPYPRSPNVEDHCLPGNFWGRDIVQSAAVADDWRALKELNPDDAMYSSKVSLADADKYEFKSAFKDVHSQMVNFEDSCGEWKPSPAYGKFDVMEAESAEGKRFYRKRITDTGLIAWHKYNLVSSTRYCPDSDVSTTKTVIVRFRPNECPKADLVWHLNQTQPLPSVDDVLNSAVITLPVPKLTKKSIHYHPLRYCSKRQSVPDLHGF